MNNYEKLAYSMNGLGEFNMDGDDIANINNSLANLWNSITGNGSSTSNQNQNTDSGGGQQVVYVPTQTSQDNTMLYVALAAVVAMAAMFAFNKK